MILAKSIALSGFLYALCAPARKRDAEALAQYALIKLILDG
jgi:hypothetical protein